MDEITVILNGFKRPQFLSEQIDAVNNQTIKPKEILSFWFLSPQVLEKFSSCQVVKRYKYYTHGFC